MVQRIEDLQSGEKRYRTLFEMMGEGFALHEIICDESGQPCDYRFLDINPAFEKLTGMRREDVVGRTFRQILPDEHPKWIDVYGRVALSGESLNFEEYSQALGKHFRILAYCPVPGQFAAVFLDVTEHKRYEAALRTSEERFRAIANYTVDWENWLDQQSRLVWVNPAVERITGYTPEECYSMPDFPLPIIAPEDRETISRQVRAIEDGTQQFGQNLEFRILRKDGALRWCAVSWQRIFDAQGLPAGHRSSVRDVTDRKQAEFELLDSRRRYQSLFSNMLDGYAYCEMLFKNGQPDDFVYVEVNPAFEKLTGLRDVVGKKVSEVVPGIQNTNPELFEIYGRVSTTGVPERFETYIDTLDIWFSIAAFSPAKGHFVAVFDNISKRKQAEEALRKANEALEMAQRAADAGTWDWDVANGRIEWSPAMFELFGLDVGRHAASFEAWRSVLHPEDIEQAERRIAESLNNHTQLDSQYRIVRPDGQVRWVSALGQGMYDEAGKPVRMLGICLDISARKRAEDELVRAKVAAETASLTKSAFLANMSHEIRTPMNGILGMTQVLLTSRLDSDQLDTVQTIAASGEALLHVVNDILDFSRVEAGKFSITPRTFGLARLISRVSDLLRSRIAEKDLRFSTEISEALPEWLIGDDVRLGQVLVNLIGNAVKFTPVGGAISLRVFHEGEESGRSRIHFIVSDTGKGIGAEFLHNIFEPFTQEDSSITRRFGGSGLGLAIAKSLVELMDGRIWAESRDGHGAVFHFTVCLPLAAEKGPDEDGPRRSVAQISRPMRSLRILIAEDEAVNQKLAVRLLEKHGHVATVAGNGVEALMLFKDACATAPFDLVLMDCQMPEMDGYTCTARMREFQATLNLHTPIIAMTAYAMEGDREKCLAAGMDDYVSKPIDIHHLIETIGRHCFLCSSP